MAQGLRMVASRMRGLAANPPPISSSPSTRALARRGISVAPGERERALLEEDPALKHYKSTKDTARRVKRIGDALVIVVSAGCIYQIYGVTQKRRAESFASPYLFSHRDHLVSRFSTQHNRSEGPSPTDSSSLLDEREFHKLADELLDYLQEKIDELGEEHDIDGFDIDHAEGVLTIKLGASGTYVINKQTPNRQIWLSSPVSGPARFDWDGKDHCWVYRRTKSELLQLLEKEMHELLGASVTLSK